MTTTTSTATTTTEISTKEIFRFLSCFREFANLPMEKGQLLISDMLCANTALKEKTLQLMDQWRSKYNRPGEFWMDLDPRVKIAFLRFWMFEMRDDAAYITHTLRDPGSVSYLRPPVLVRKMTNVIKFFEEHRIDDEMADAIDLPAVPQEHMRAAGTFNWISFLFSLPPYMNSEMHTILETIRDFYPKIKLKNQED